MNKADLHAALAQRAQGGSDLLLQRGLLIIANPEFEQIPQDIQGLGTAGLLLKKGDKRGSELGAMFAEVQISDEQGRHSGLRTADAVWQARDKMGRRQTAPDKSGNSDAFDHDLFLRYITHHATEMFNAH